ncbi:hypothetical protein ACEE24_06675 [Latilactobacillus curvatus]|uniref:phosphoribosyltransferase n=1 Tax=Latilactobacillus curvatus TaxID=28038 RepID=UPI0020C7F745|nr:phosphoribosyltransferase [Latilactobacillus curvatus]MCP8876526.1 phosphoribosyltransferase [Latilactobacillus curvatus]
MQQNWTVYFAGRSLFDVEDGRYKAYFNIYRFLDTIKNLNINISIVTHDRNLKQYLKEKLTNVEVYGRHEIRSLFKDKSISNEKSIFIGPSNDDLYIAAAYKLLYINPEWSSEHEVEAEKYGIKIKEPDQLISMLKILINQHKWFYSLKISEKSELISLMSANSYWADEREKNVLDQFQEVLKHGSEVYKDALTFHLISGMMQYEELYNIDYWAAMPSSGTEPSEVLVELKDRCRHLTGKRVSEPLLIRYKKIEKSHYLSPEERIKMGASRLFDSVTINPYFKGKLKGKTICLIDDYVTNGATTEMARNLLEKTGVKKIIFVSLGRYLRYNGVTYQKEDYQITGDVYEAGYTYVRDRFDISYGDNAVKETAAKDEVKKIYDILNGTGDE